MCPVLILLKSICIIIIFCTWQLMKIVYIWKLETFWHNRIIFDTLLLKQKWVPMQLDLLWIFLLMIYWIEYNWCYQFVIQITLNKLNYVWMMMKLFFFLFLQIKSFCSIFLLNVLRNNIVILRICGVGHTQTYQDDMHYFIFQLEIFKYHYHCHYYYQTRI